jgi:hypothetical protein
MMATDPAGSGPFALAVQVGAAAVVLACRGPALEAQLT